MYISITNANKNPVKLQLNMHYCLFQVLRCLLERLGRVDVEGVVLDFEQAAWQAVREIFPGVEIKGCAFHWAQAVWRHVQEAGLAETYRKWIGENIRL